MGRDLFRGLTIAAVGDFGPLRSHRVLRQWVERRGAAYKQNVSMVRTARFQRIPIVSYDWLEGSNIAGVLKPMQGRYLVQKAVKNQKRRKRKEKLIKEITVQRAIEVFDKECQDLKEKLLTDRYQIHRDVTGFAYNIILVRVNVLQNTSERCYLKLCSTHETPKGYTCFLTHHSPRKNPETTFLTNKRCDWFTAWAAFQKAFKEKTKLDWDSRLEVKKVYDEDVFVYIRPKEGELRGYMMEDYIPRWLRGIL
ncbi:MAG: hypothetical protein Q9209_005662 [Squamulea sp. 1 TL-2023]